MGILAKIEALLKGKKTYLVALLAGVLTAIQVLNPEFVVPLWGWQILGALGLGAIRSAIANKTP